tara:strand:- start:10749 stop:12071 length:1323 start_codon:yes stop_codon:yes gene_type:complete
VKHELEKYIIKNKLFDKNSKLLLAVSGGADSIALAYLLNQLGYNFIIAHCNFKLRGKESDNDEFFVKEFANNIGVKYYTKSFKTQDFSIKNKISLQMAARDLRYEWFEKIREKRQCDFIVTGHHQDDSVETFFINLLRGTGIKGMLGINNINGRIIRPLLFASKLEILEFTNKKKIEFREDMSNKDVKYTRNKIRLELIPLLNEINPSFQNTLDKEKDYLSLVSELYFREIDLKRERILKKKGELFHISKSDLKKLKPLKAYLYEFLKPFGFSNIDDVISAIPKQSGKKFYSDSHRIIIDRKDLIIQKITNNEQQNFIIQRNDKNLLFPLHLNFKVTDKIEIKKDKQLAMLDFDKLNFPLVLRKWNRGDHFVPLGIKGKKKISDFFIDKKISIPNKENIWLLCSGKEIVWIVNYRISEMFKITETSKKMYIVQLLEKINE